MDISCISGCHGDVMTPLQYSVPVAVLYFCLWTIEIVNSLFFCYALLISFFLFFKLYSPVLQVPVHFLIQVCHQEITVLFILNA